MALRDIDALKASVDLCTLFEHLTGETLKNEGVNAVAHCPFHEEKTPSFKIHKNDQYYTCFGGCSQQTIGSDHIDLIERIKGLDAREAIDYLEDFSGGCTTDKTPDPRPRQLSTDEGDWLPQIPFPKGAQGLQASKTKTNPIWMPSAGAFREYDISLATPVRDENGGLICAVIRKELPGGGKLTLPVTFCKNKHTGIYAWVLKKPTGSLPFINLDKVKNNPETPVLYVSGEKALTKAEEIVDGHYIVVTNMSGDGSIAKADWSGLKGRTVYIWPDNDLKHEILDTKKIDIVENGKKKTIKENVYSKDPLPMEKQSGFRAALNLRAILESAANPIIIIPPQNGICGWDLGDAKDWDLDDVTQHIDNNHYQPKEIAISEQQKAVDERIIKNEYTKQYSRGCLPFHMDGRGLPALPEVEIGGGKMAPYWPDLPSKHAVPATVDNMLWLTHLYDIICRYNVITKDPEYLIPGVTNSSENNAELNLILLESLAEKYGMAGSRACRVALKLADDNQYNPVLRYIQSKKWDGVDRLQAWFDTITTTKQEDTALKEMIMLRWAIGAIAIAINEDERTSLRICMVFKGEQEGGKTRWFKNLVCDHMKQYLIDGFLLDTKSKDSVYTACSHWLVELGELDGTLKTSDSAALKAYITKTFDKFRRPYDKTDKKFTRRTALFASVNEDEFLIDKTGNTRFGVIDVTKINAAHNIDMQQFWAQAYEQQYIPFKDDDIKPWYFTKEEQQLQKENNKYFQSIDPMQELIHVEFITESDRDSWTTKLMSAEILKMMGYDKPDQKLKNRLAHVLKTEFGLKVKKTGSKRFYEMPRRRLPAEKNF